ncbi:MAG TPA: Fe2+-dependent dioxygenase [Burkholderiales bacterium]|nr:Fe2+-dependent dioxygenase [Burkholderiales bacterium]
MFLPLPKVLKDAEVKQVRERLAKASFGDGAATAGKQARRVKQNEQVPRGSALAKELGAVVLAALRRSGAFISATLPCRITEPMFNRYAAGMRYGSHVDNAVMYQPQPLRSDISVTVFLSAPEEYDGGELLIDEIAVRQKVKLAAGSALIYPSTSLHRVEPVTRGERLAAIIWIQSLVRDPAQRRILFDLDRATQAITKRDPDSAEAEVLGASYHNLLRMWAEA